MSDSYSDPQPNGREHDGSRETARGGFRGGRGQSRRDAGGFRIRLSDNEMRAARSLQEAFDLRSTVAVLGFSVRTLAQMLEEGKLGDVIEQSKIQTNRGGNRRGGDGPHQQRRNRFNNDSQGDSRKGPKPNPFARPEKPQPNTNENAEDSNQTEESAISDPINSEELALDAKEINEEVQSQTNNKNAENDEINPTPSSAG